MSSNITVIVTTQDLAATAIIYEQRSSPDDEASRAERIGPHDERVFHIRKDLALRIVEERQPD